MTLRSSARRLVGTGEHEAQPSPDQRPPAARRWRRRLSLFALGYVVLFIVGQLGLFATQMLSRMIGDDPRTEFSGVPNFRVVDEKVWAGGQPYDEHTYRKLAAQDVRLVVDLRTGAPDDRNEDDPDLLRTLGIEYLRLPVRDGHVPSDDQVDQFLDAVQRTDGMVLVHCGAGVGRSSSFTSAYERRTGSDPDVADLLSLGSHTGEQTWFVATGDTNPVVRRLSEAIDAPRRAWSRLRSL